MEKIHKKMMDRRSRDTAIKDPYNFDFLTIREKHGDKVVSSILELTTQHGAIKGKSQIKLCALVSEKGATNQLVYLLRV